MSLGEVIVNFPQALVELSKEARDKEITLGVKGDQSKEEQWDP